MFSFTANRNMYFFEEFPNEVSQMVISHLTPLQKMAILRVNSVGLILINSTLRNCGTFKSLEDYFHSKEIIQISKLLCENSYAHIEDLYSPKSLEMVALNESQIALLANYTENEVKVEDITHIFQKPSLAEYMKVKLTEYNIVVITYQNSEGDLENKPNKCLELHKNFNLLFIYNTTQGTCTKMVYDHKNEDFRCRTFKIINPLTLVFQKESIINHSFYTDPHIHISAILHRSDEIKGFNLQ